ncbi:hypothetical protein Hanom_Chr15g01393371 [Helianthus anomalus]
MLSMSSMKLEVMVVSTDEVDQEGLAMCLMMLSKDSANWAVVNSFVESSDNNSIVLETKSYSVERISKKSSGGLDADSVQFEIVTARKVESDISVEELL